MKIKIHSEEQISVHLDASELRLAILHSVRDCYENERPDGITPDLDMMRLDIAADTTGSSAIVRWDTTEESTA